MNIQNLVTSLQQVASSSTSALDVMTLSKAVEKLQVGTIETVTTSANLPIDLTTSGNIYYVTGDEAIYYNVGATWKSFYSIDPTDVYAWGGGGGGQLGDGTTTNRSSPVTVVGGINWSQVSAASSSGSFSLGITVAGIAYAWGTNSAGQLGDNTATGRSSPVTVVGGITTWSQVSAGETHSLGLTSAGIAYAWGNAGSGRLGDNTITNKSSPVTVVGGITTWSKIFAGEQHSLGITSAGIAYAWGNGGSGRIGDNTDFGRSSPVTVVGGITTWFSLAGGGDHSLGRTSAGIAYAWGNNGVGKLGDGTTTGRSSPVTVVGGITTWSQLAGGENHSLGVTSTGIAYAWGYNSYGRLGDDTLTGRNSPVTVVGGITNWSQVSAGRRHSLGLTSTGITYAWGYNGSGQLGDNTTTSRRSPVTVVGGITTWSQLSAGSSSNLAAVSSSTPILNTQAAI